MNKKNEVLEAKYGLPCEVKFCKKCVMSNQRPTSSVEFKHTKDKKHVAINFDENGVCDACRNTSGNIISTKPCHNSSIEDLRSQLNSQAESLSRDDLTIKAIVLNAALR